MASEQLVYKTFLAFNSEIMIFKCIFPKGFQNSKTTVNTNQKNSQEVPVSI